MSMLPEKMLLVFDVLIFNVFPGVLNVFPGVLNVIPVKTGIHKVFQLDSHFRGNDIHDI